MLGVPLCCIDYYTISGASSHLSVTSVPTDPSPPPTMLLGAPVLHSAAGPQVQISPGQVLGVCWSGGAD